MKKFLFAFCTFLFLFTFVETFVYAEDIVGTYEGWYYANQGQTGLTLTINDDYSGVFEFYNMPGKSNAANGSYTVTVTKINGEYRVDGDEWIERPSSYHFVYLIGTLNNGVYSGTVDGNSWQFVLTKNNSDYQKVSDSVFENHKYEVFDEGLTWTEAEQKCEEKGGHLASITSENEQKQIEKLLVGKNKNGYWIGGIKNGDSWEWVNGDSWSYENWSPGQPDGYEEDSNYVQMINNPDSNYIADAEQYAWQDIPNTGESGNRTEYFSADKTGYICEWETWTDSNSWSTDELQRAADNNLIPDVLIGKDMTQPITRGEFAAVAVNLFEAMTGGKAVMSSECNFKDIAENENRNYILKAYNIGAVAGYDDTTFAPDDLLQREQLAAMLCRVYKRSEWPEWTIETDDNYTINYSGVEKFADDELISEYAKPSVYFMVKYGVLSGVGNNKFAPKNTTSAEEAEGYANATREQAIVMSLRSFENLN